MNQQSFNEEEWSKKLDELIAQNQEDVENALTRIHSLIAEMGSFNVIANISYLNLWKKADDYQDYAPDMLPAVAEYVALLCLKHPFFVGQLEFIDPEKFHSGIREIQECGMSIVLKVPFIKQFLKNKDRELDLDSIEELARNFESEEYYVRNPAFDTHHWEVLEELFESFDQQLQSILGFSVSDAIDLCYSIGSIVMAKTKQALVDSAKKADQKYYEILRYKSDGIKPENVYPEELLAQLITLSKKELKQHFMIGADFYAATTFGYFYSFTAAELAEESEIEIQVVNNYLDSLSIGFQSMPTDFWEPQAMHPLKETPIITAEERYIVPAPSLLDWAIDQLFEKALLGASGKVPNRYTSAKHDYLITKTLNSFHSIIPDAEIHSECEYYFEGNNGETDGIILWDDCLFIVEAKGQRITDSAKRGGVGRVERHIDEIFNKAYSQGIRAMDYIESEDKVEMRPKGKKPIQIRNGDYRHKFLIISSFAQLGHIAPLIKKSNELGVFDGDTYPYVVSIYDALVLRDIIDFPSLVPYYIQRRSKFFEAKKFRITDEVDVLGNFLKYGLYFDHLDPEDEMDTIQLPGHLDEFNQYYFFLEGLTRKAYKKPSYELNTKTRRFIQLLETSGIKHRTTASLFILDLSPDSQKSFISRVESAKKLLRKDRKLHDISIGGKRDGGRWGLTFMTHTNKVILSKNLNQYCKYKAKQQKADLWIGIGDCGLKEYQIYEIVVFHTPN